MGQEDYAGRYLILLDKKNDWERLTGVAHGENKDLLRRIDVITAEKQALEDSMGRQPVDRAV